jgi:predicted outer membrane repeat protein
MKRFPSTATILIVIPLASGSSSATGSATLRRRAASLVTRNIQLDQTTPLDNNRQQQHHVTLHVELEPFDINTVGVLSNAKKCTTFMDQLFFPPAGDKEYTTCISTELEFERQLLDDNVTAMLLCDNFVYNSLDTLDLSGQTKTIVCRSGCQVHGKLFNGDEEESAFTATGSAVLTFCGIDFVDFFYSVRQKEFLCLRFQTRKVFALYTMRINSPYLVFLISFSFDCHRQQSRVFLMNGTDVKSSFEECSFRNNGFISRGTSNSGVISVLGGAVSFANSTFVGNQAPRGGVLQAAGSAIVTARNCEFHENIGTLGGVFIAGSGVVTSITNSLFSKNTAAYGGVIVYLGNGTSTFSGSEMIGNVASISGGVSHIGGSFGMTTNFVSSRMSNNTATMNGGVASLSPGSRTTITSCEVTDNKAGEQGGAIYADIGASVLVTLSDFNGNVAGSDTSGASETFGNHIWFPKGRFSLHVPRGE